ncbi:MAG: hypothetical protein A3K19_04360 [Lentisphaerae bacterium RIFOXYB12_FULL_65_16]|nr:MAG: hypothetical protein A3K18_34830 [Lentisphaerae bacterium RIFOXYA12_64_32]OGV84554.1 MAG: hypothetical protein A3K19_04360 [Lentisphaerae bacterium RIFOXYB12_FULL_65_16]
MRSFGISEFSWTVLLLPGLCGLMLFVAGCETTEMTSLEENSAAYADARAFLRLGVTTREQALAKFGKPPLVEEMADGGVKWEYTRTEMVVVNAYTRTPVGTEGALMAGERGFQHTTSRKSRMELFFDKAGILSDYRIDRDTLQP